jgi:hypothetical protein
MLTQGRNDIMNTKEIEVLKAMADAAIDATGGDFGCSDEVSVSGLTGNQLGGYMSVLEKKGMVALAPTSVNGKKLVQYTITDAGWKAAGHPELVGR